jgi:4-amino-4-deoxy-L-arabinose transferase-like glycosyltransferase
MLYLPSLSDEVRSSSIMASLRKQEYSSMIQSRAEPARVEAPGGSTRRLYGWLLAAVLSAGFLIRVCVAVEIPTVPVSDFWEYMRSAQSLARTGRYEASPGIPNSGHPPAYPLLLSLALRLAPPDDLFAAKLVNFTLAVLAGLLGATFARRFWGDTAALCTAAWLAFFPRSLLTADLIASENLFSPLLLLFLLLAAISWTRRPSFLLAASIGGVIGLLTLTRSVAYFLPIVWLVGAVASRRPARRLAAELLLVVVAEHAVLLPWAMRNSRAVGRFTFLNTVGGVGLFIGNNSHATGDWYDWIADLETLRPGISRLGPIAIDRAAREEALRWIAGNPGSAALLYVRKLRIILTDDGLAAAFTIFGEGNSPPGQPASVLPGPSPLKRHPQAVHRLLRASGVLLALCALGGFVLLVRRARKGSVVDRTLAAGFVAAALYVPIVSAAIAVNGRYRWPVEDVITPLAGLFLSKAASLLRRS